MSGKAELRRRLLEARAKRSAADRDTAADRIRSLLLAIPEVDRADVVAAYVGIATEPATIPLLDALRERRVRVLLPVLRPDGDLDWAAYDGTDALAPGPHGLRQPTGTALGVDAIASAAVVAVPALGVDDAGNRLGRGGGAYDRALSRATGLTVAVVYADELVGRLPVEAHDVPVAAAVTPDGLIRFSPGH